MNSQTNINVIRNFLENNDVSYSQPEEHLFLSTYHAEQAAYRVVLRAEAQPPLFMTTVVMPLNVPVEKRPAFSELVTRINLGLMLGRFELDFSDGDLLWTASHPLFDADLTDTHVGEYLMLGLRTADHFFRGFGRLLFDGDLTPAEALAEIQMAASEQRNA